MRSRKKKKVSCREIGATCCLWLSAAFLNSLVALILFTETFNVGITYVQNAVGKGAVCLDGSPPAYHFSKGFGAGTNNWLVHFEGGGWCNNATTCLARRDTQLGSSKQMAKEVAFSGILSKKHRFNPDFYNWNRIKVRYCDGASFTGDVEAVDPATNLHFRGARAFVAIIEDLMSKGMSNAQNAILSGCSAGGLTSILHCDRFRALMPANAKVKCLADAGYFINAKDISGVQRIETFYSEVVATHGSAKNLPTSCTSKLKPGLCFFPQNVAKQIQTPIFLLNAAYDLWQIKNILVPGVADPHGTWHSCKLDISNCSPNQLKTMQDFRLQFLKALSGLETSPSVGMFIDSCYVHCQSEMQKTWLRDDSPELAKTTIAEAVGDWYYDRSPFQKIDCAYPCNFLCRNQVFDPYEYLEDIAPQSHQCSVSSPSPAYESRKMDIAPQSHQCSVSSPSPAFESRKMYIVSQSHQCSASSLSLAYESSKMDIAPQSHQCSVSSPSPTYKSRKMGSCSLGRSKHTEL